MLADLIYSRRANNQRNLSGVVVSLSVFVSNFLPGYEDPAFV